MKLWSVIKRNNKGTNRKRMFFYGSPVFHKVVLSNSMKTNDNYSWYVLSMCRLYARYIKQNKPLQEFSFLERLDINSVEKALRRLHSENKDDAIKALEAIYLNNVDYSFRIRAITEREEKYCTENNLDLREFNKTLAYARKIIAEERGLRIGGKY